MHGEEARRLARNSILSALLLLAIAAGLGGWFHYLQGRVERLAEDMKDPIAGLQYVKIEHAPPDDRTVVIVRRPSDTAAEFAQLVRDFALDRTMLRGSGRVESKTTTWVRNGVTFEVVTFRDEGESEDEWCKRHEEAVEALGGPSNP